MAKVQHCNNYYQPHVAHYYVGLSEESQKIMRSGDVEKYKDTEIETVDLFCRGLNHIDPEGDGTWQKLS